MPSVGPMELIVVLVIALVVLGPKRLPGLGKQLGTGMREFKDGISGITNHDDDDDRPALKSAEKAPRVESRVPVAEPVPAPVAEPVHAPVAEAPSSKTSA
jgi:sec-independent protein translocase protein TatA